MTFAIRPFVLQSCYIIFHTFYTNAFTLSLTIANSASQKRPTQLCRAGLGLFQGVGLPPPKFKVITPQESPHPQQVPQARAQE